jgi:hypothetical protein
MSNYLRPRWKECLQLRGEGLSFRQIGERLGISGTMAHLHYLKATRQDDKKNPLYGLSVRAKNCLKNCDIATRGEALDAYNSGLLKPLKHPRLYGWKTHKEVAAWLGLPEPIKPKPK